MSMSSRKIKKLKKEKRETKKGILDRTISRLKGNPRELHVVSYEGCRFKIIEIDKIKMEVITVNEAGRRSRISLKTDIRTNNFFVLNKTNRQLLEERVNLENSIQTLQRKVDLISHRFIEPVTTETRF